MNRSCHLINATRSTVSNQQMISSTNIIDDADSILIGWSIAPIAKPMNNDVPNIHVFHSFSILSII